MSGALVLLISVFLNVASGAPTEKPWNAEIPTIAQDSQAWISLSQALREEQMVDGLAASAKRLLTFFSDVHTKELSHRILIDLVDQGFPLPIRDTFYVSDLQPDTVPVNSEDYSFVNTYYLYKLILSEQHHLTKWASDYLLRIDKDHFPKYQFYTALKAYEAQDLGTARDIILRLLGNISNPSLYFSTTVMRTLARIYFEQEEYEKSLDIYSSFLLKLNPITPSDWLESAWNLFHLKRYEEALGQLYNLESPTALGYELDLEKYSIRALIYRNTCSAPQMSALIQNFENTYGTFIDKIKQGFPLQSIAILDHFKISEQSSYQNHFLAFTRLHEEKSQISRLPKKNRSLANYLYESELKMLGQELKLDREKALIASATQLVLTLEQMKFLKFDIERQKFSPDMIFSESESTHPTITGGEGEDTFAIHWIQYGDYWLDERTGYKGILPNRCSN